MMKRNIEKIIVVVVIILSFIIKVYSLDKSPPSVGFDEAALGYNAYSILKTGKDEYGNFMPLSLRSFNDYKPALYAYLSIPFIAVMGLNEISTRMVSVVAGTFSLLFLYFFLNEFVKNKYLRWFVFVVLAFQPWRIHFSRVALEANLSACFFVIGAWFLYKNSFLIKEKKRKIKMLTIPFFFALSAYSYHGARAAVPAFIVLFLFDPFKLFFVRKFEKYKKWLLKFRLKYFYLLLIFILFLIPIFVVNKSSQILTRFRQENVFYRYSPFTPSELLTEGKNAWLNLENNPLYYFMGIMTGHMLSYFSPINLGGRIFYWVKNSVQHIPSFSMLGWAEVIVFVFGIVNLIKNFRLKAKNRFLVYWILAGAAPAALTWNWFHPLRSMNIYVALELIIALGFVSLFGILKKRLGKSLFKIICMISIFFFSLTALFTIISEYNYATAINHGEYQPGGFKEGVPILAKLQDNYDEVIIDSPHAQSYIFFLFYQSFNPEIVQSYTDQRPKPGVEGNLNFDFYKYKFEKYNWTEQKNKSKILIWTNSEVKEEEVKNTLGTDLIWVPNAVREKETAIIIKD
jgi:4-amino-4-deoxy-L-arabinose transferase-like glycosyltransferase